MKNLSYTHAARSLRLVPLTLLLSLCAAVSASAQQMPNLSAVLLTRDEIQQKIKQIEALDTLDANIKARILETYAQALTEVQTAEDWRKRAAESIELRASAPETILDLEAEAAQPIDVAATAINPATTSLDVLVDMLTNAEREFETAQNAVAAIQQEAATRTTRRTQLDSLIAAARTAIDQTRSMVAPTNAGPEEIEALRIYALARTQALEAEIVAYNEELANFEIRGRLLAMQEEVAQRNVEIARRNVEPLRTIVADERVNDAKRALADAEQARRDAANAPPPIRESVEAITESSVQLAARRTGDSSPQAKLVQVNSESTRVQADLERLTDERARIQAREETIGLTEAVGTLLRTYRDNLPPRSDLLANLRLRKKAINQALLEQIELAEARSEVSTTAANRRVEDILAAASADNEIPQAQLDDYKAQLSAFLTTQRRLLSLLISEHESYVNALMALNEKDKQLLARRDEFADYISQRVLWIASADVIGVEDVRRSINALRGLIDWRNWTDVVATLGRDLRDAPAPTALALATALFIGLLYPRIRRRMATLAEQAGRRTATNYFWTIETLTYEFILATLLPLVVLYFGWRLSASLTAGDFARVFGLALMYTAAMYASMDIPRRFLATRGLGEIHFGWPPEAAATARRTLVWAMPAGLTLFLFIAIMDIQDSTEWRESAGRFGFVVLMMIWAVMGHRLTNKHAPSITIYLPLTIPGAHRDRVRRGLYLLSAGAPVTFAAASLLGYFDTAQRLALNVHITLVFIFALSCGVGLAMRALLITRRRIAIEQARKKRAELREAQKKSADGGDLPSGTDVQESEIDLAQIDVQTTRLTRSAAIIVLTLGLWFIWVDYIPALRVLDQITIGDTTAPIRAVADLPMGGNSTLAPPATAAAATPPADASGTPVAATTAPAAPTTSEMLTSSDALVGAVEALTLADLLVSAIIIMLTVSAVRNLPGLMEIAILQRLSLAAGERYAIKTVMGYVFAVVGTIAVLNVLGIRWERAQWLVAALGLGIGFGLQEIFANFISGLIILFERPVRLGDIVTVGNVSGTVTRIQIRATTITDAERKDLIVPNKEFVTGQIMNWSLTDPIIRTTISLGVDYGSDTRKVRDILMQVANDNSRVLKEPRPEVLFTEFGASTLNFELRAFVGGIAELMPCRDELHHGINDALRAAGIEIAFNQTDVHIRSVPTSLTLGGTPLPKEIEKQ